MPQHINPKWRPTLSLVLGGALTAVLTLPLVGLLAMRLLSDTMVFRHSALLIGAIVAVATLILGFLLWRLLLNPIVALAERAAAMKSGHAGPPVPLPHYGTQELRDLGQSVLDMAEALQNREATIRSFTDHVTHELKAPITAIRGAAEMLEGNAGLAAQDLTLLANILISTQRMEQQLTALRRVAAAREPTHHGEARLADIAAALQAGFPAVSLDVSGADVSVPLNVEGLQIVLSQLIDNAAAHGATKVTVAASASPTGVTISVQDDGQGVSDGNRPHIFTPFFTSRRESGGTGMGLNIVTGLLLAHGGSIAHIPSSGGACFRLEF